MWFSSKSKENLLSSFDGWPNQRNTRTQHWSSDLEEFSTPRVESKKAPARVKHHSRPFPLLLVQKSQSLIKGYCPFLTPTHFPISYQLHATYIYVYFDWWKIVGSVRMDGCLSYHSVIPSLMLFTWHHRNKQDWKFQSIGSARVVDLWTKSDDEQNLTMWTKLN